ncbi:MAG: nucleoside deaminase [Acholeplasmatales bacterium]
MKVALEEAKKAFLKDEVPVGCVVVYNDKIIAKAHNRRKKNNTTCAHAEMLAIKKANKKLKSWRLEDCDIYVTLEPCAMCAGAIMQARMRTIIYALEDNKSGALGGSFNLYENKFNHEVVVKKGPLKEEAKELIQAFFQKLRKK